jgi:hypothetical protein
MTMIAAFVTDILLVLIMFRGLVYMGCPISGTFSTGRVLWNQVCWWPRLLSMVYQT